MLVLGRDIVYDRSTAFAHDVSYEKCFPRRWQNNLATYGQGYTFVLKLKAQLISSVLQYHSSLDNRKCPDCFLKFEQLLVTYEACL